MSLKLFELKGIFQEDSTITSGFTALFGLDKSQPKGTDLIQNSAFIPSDPVVGSAGPSAVHMSTYSYFYLSQKVKLFEPHIMIHE